MPNGAHLATVRPTLSRGIFMRRLMLAALLSVAVPRSDDVEIVADIVGGAAVRNNQIDFVVIETSDEFVGRVVED